MFSSLRSTHAIKSRLGAIPRSFSSQATPEKSKYKIIVVGGGTSGLSVANQIYNRFKAAGKSFNDGDIAILDANEFHYYQPGWTLVGSGLKQKTETRKPLASLIPKHLTLVPENAASFQPTKSALTTSTGRELSYDTLVVAAGLQINWGDVQGLPKALADPTSGVSSIYSYDTCDKVWHDIEALRAGPAVFTQPAGVLKCAGAPQKIMWMAWDRFRRTGRRDNIKMSFYTGIPTMFSVKKYSDALNQLRIDRGVDGYFQHNLIAVDTANHKATFKKADGSTTDVDYTFLHVTPPMGAPNFLKGSPISDDAGYVAVDSSTLQHVKFDNIFSLGDCSSLPTSKTAAAVTAQTPILTENLFSVVDTGKVSGTATYDGYTSCPLLTGYGELMLCEFKYGFVPKETFSSYFGDQSKSRRIYYHLKKDIFPRAYWNAMVKGLWYGTNGLIRPKY
ncbi:hypothetical protein ONZ45_g2777 [Pleurotus djamor]|nr:hypothetical protein ONZ45_g2777 [Pleurotus djamor]